MDMSNKDLKVETFRSRGAGGQHVNKTESAVRITHIPTKLSISCQSERSQSRNKALAVKMLRLKLNEFNNKQSLELSNEYLTQHLPSLRTQIRSYVFFPYKLVRDNKTGYEFTNINRILDGNLDVIIIGYLIWKKL